jgi:MoaA/NifB/PqqE/SkfB family radical SAM enzyme
MRSPGSVECRVGWSMPVVADRRVSTTHQALDVDKMFARERGLWELLSNQHLPTVSLNARVETLAGSAEWRRAQPRGEATIQITNHCSADCKACSQASGPNAGGNMGTARVIQIVSEQLSECDTIRLSGGEPFEHPDVLGIIRGIKALKVSPKWGSDASTPRVEILSIGSAHGRSLPAVLLEELRAAGVEDIIFSLHGRGQSHDKYVSGRRELFPYFEALASTVFNCIALPLPIRASFQTVLTAHSYPLLREIAETVRDFREIMFLRLKYKTPPLMGHWRVLRFIPRGRGYSNQDKLSVSREIEEGLPSEVRRLGEEFRIPVSYSSTFEDGIRAPAQIVLSNRGFPVARTK